MNTTEITQATADLRVRKFLLVLLVASRNGSVCLLSLAILPPRPFGVGAEWVKMPHDVPQESPTVKLVSGRCLLSFARMYHFAAHAIAFSSPREICSISIFHQLHTVYNDEIRLCHYSLQATCVETEHQVSTFILDPNTAGFQEFKGRWLVF